MSAEARLRSGIHIYMNGHGPLAPDSTPLVVGKLGRRELTVGQGAAAARPAGLHADIPVEVEALFEISG